MRKEIRRVWYNRRGKKIKTILMILSVGCLGMLVAADAVMAQTGACCVNEECVETNTEAECIALGGDWYAGETCPEFQCPGPPPNDNCEDVAPVLLEYDTSLVFSGNDYNASDDCENPSSEPEVWEAFYTEVSMPVGISYCGSNQNRYVDFRGVFTDCPCEDYIMADWYNYDDCADHHITFGFDWLPAGIYYIQISSDDGLTGDYIISVMASYPQTGACCVNDSCVGTMEEMYCWYAGGYWYENEDCDQGFECPTDYPCGHYVVGDYNCSGSTNVADVVEMYSKLKTSAPVYPDCECDCLGDGNIWAVGGDVNNSCTFNIADVVKLYSVLMPGGPIWPCLICPPEP